jgi:hypothetical protein
VSKAASKTTPKRFVIGRMVFWEAYPGTYQFRDHTGGTGFVSARRARRLVRRVMLTSVS